MMERAVRCGGAGPGQAHSEVPRPAGGFPNGEPEMAKPKPIRRRILGRARPNPFDMRPKADQVSGGMESNVHF